MTAFAFTGVDSAKNAGVTLSTSEVRQNKEMVQEPKNKKINALFQQAMEEEDGEQERRQRLGYHPTIVASAGSETEKRKQDRMEKEMRKMMQEYGEDVFKYDEHLDDDEMAKKYNNLHRTDALEQVKRTGLTVMKEDYHEALAKKKSHYVEGMKEMKERREVERAILEQKAINREIEKEDAKPEAFVTGAYARELEKRKTFEKKLLEQDKLDEAAFQKNSTAAWGFSGELHANLLKERETGAGGGGLGEPASGAAATATAEAGTATTQVDGAGMKQALGPARPPGAPAPVLQPQHQEGPAVLGPMRPEGPSAPQTKDAAAPNNKKDESSAAPEPAVVGPSNKRSQEQDQAADGEAGEETKATPGGGGDEQSKRPRLVIPTAEESIAQREKEEAMKLQRELEARKQEALAEKERKLQQEQEKEERKTKAQSAKERYLARKKQG